MTLHTTFVIVINPLQPFEEEGKYSTTFLYLHGILVAQSDWLMWQLSHLDWVSLPQTA